MTRLLLDTHFVIYLTGDVDAIRPGESEALESAELPWLVSAVSIWEIRIKWKSFNRFGERRGPISPEFALETMKADRPRFRLVPLRVEQLAMAPLDPPLAHGDPFDEMLLLQAEAEGARLFTRDKNLAGHPLALTI